MFEQKPSQLVSVIVPAYKHEDYILAALESVAKQTYGNIELIVLDDCSVDATLQIAKQWSEVEQQKKRFARLVVERNPRNIGAHATINRGISICRGEYISILNSDDTYDSERIQLMLESAIANKASLLFSGVRVIDSHGQRFIKPGLASEIESMVDYVDAFPSLSCALLSKNIAVSTGNLFFSSQLINQIGGFRPLRYCHDWDFALRASLIVEPFLVPLPLYNYRMHETNSFTSLKIEKYVEPQIIYQYYMNSCKSGNYDNKNCLCSQNWPLLYEEIVENSENICFGNDIVGGSYVKYDRLARSVLASINIKEGC